MRLHRTGLLIITTATLGLSAPTAQADTQYGGSATRNGQPWHPSVSLVQRDDGSVTGRLAFGYSCRSHRNSNLTARIRGTWSGATFTASGKTRMRGVGQLRFSVSGALAPGAASGTLRLRVRGCKGYTRPFALRTESAPAGAPAAPARGSLHFGLSGQAAAGVRLPVIVRVAKNGRLYAVWHATMKCGPKAVVSMGNVTPTTAIKADGTFSRRETYTIRYTDGSSERYRVTFAGRFLADGVTGTLRARMQTRRKGQRYYPCDSGTQNWAARI